MRMERTERTEERLRVAERDLAVERARMDEIFARMAKVERAAAHPEQTLVFRDERRRMWNQITLIGVLAGASLGLALSIVAFLAGSA